MAIILTILVAVFFLLMYTGQAREVFLLRRKVSLLEEQNAFLRRGGSKWADPPNAQKENAQ